MDIAGNVYVSDELGLHVFKPSGEAFEGSPLDVGAHVVNMGFGGSDWKDLLISTKDGLLKMRVKIPGPPLPFQ